MTQPPTRLARDVVLAVAAVVIARLAVNGGVRVVYPFLPEIARGLGVSLGVVSALVALRSMVGVGAPLVARATEVLGRRTMMLAGVGAVLAGSLVLAGSAGLVGATVGFVLLGLAKPGFDVPMQGWFGARVPYRRRSRVLGITELTWALSLLATVPVSGVLIARYGWQSPFLLVAVLAGIGIVAVWSLMAPDRPAMPERRPLRWTPQRLRILGVVLAFSVAAEMLFVVYGAWLEDDLGLSVAAIGLFTIVVVAAELAGEGGVAAVGDRIGPRRTILAGLAVSAVAYASLGLVGGSLMAAIAAVVVWFVGFEVTIVAAIPLVSELGADARERLLSMMISMIAAARALGALVAPALYGWGGIAASGLVAATLVGLAALLLVGVQEPTETSPAR